MEALAIAFEGRGMKVRGIESGAMSERKGECFPKMCVYCLKTRVMRMCSPPRASIPTGGHPLLARSRPDSVGSDNNFIAAAAAVPPLAFAHALLPTAPSVISP